MTKKHYTIPIFIPELACPFQCVFCDQRKITGKNLIPDDRMILETIETHLQSFKEKNRTVEVGFFGGSFTGIPKDQQAHFLQLVQPYLLNNAINGIRISTRPDYIDQEILDLLKDHHVSTIELGAQSMDDDVLKVSHRGHTAEQTEKASAMIRASDIELGLQMMIGLPGDTLDKALITAKRFFELKASNTRIYPAVVIKDTSLHHWYNKGKYKPLSLNEAVNWTKQIFPLFEAAGVKVLRVGLHPSEGLLTGNDLIAGPFHPSFKELVLTEIWADLFSSILIESKKKNIEILVPEKEMNYAIGYGSKNRNELLKVFEKVKFVPDRNITNRYSFQYR